MSNGETFGTTQWGLVAAASAPSDEQSRWALSLLCEQYWFPIYAYIRRQGYPAHQAEDLTQAFFALILEKKTFSRADPQRGRLRTYLLGALRNFLAGQFQKQSAARRGGGRRVVPLDPATAEGWLQAAGSDGQSPEKLFDRQWALTVLDLAMRRLRGRYFDAGKADLFELLVPQLTGDDAARCYRELGAQVAMSEGAVKVAVHRLRQEYRQILREQIGQTLVSADEVDEEVRHLFAALGK